jgi:hypothetical protein
MQCNLMCRYVAHASYYDHVPLMGLVTFCVLRIVAQSSFPELFAMPCTNPNQRAELERRETREQQEDMIIADLPGSPVPEDLGPMFLRPYVLKMFCALSSIGWKSRILWC